jgi:hypothetical protein
MAKKDTDTNERTFDKKLPVQLSDDEERQMGLDHARTHAAIKDEKEKKKDISAKIKELTERADKLEKALTSGVEERLVEVKEVVDWKAKCVTLVRLDTGETIEERAMRADEIQKPLNLKPGQSKVDDKDSKGKAGKTPPSKPTPVKDGKDSK